MILLTSDVASHSSVPSGSELSSREQSTRYRLFVCLFVYLI
jgi:hypothetical protein